MPIRNSVRGSNGPNTRREVVQRNNNQYNTNNRKPRRQDTMFKDSISWPLTNTKERNTANNYRNNNANTQNTRNNAQSHKEANWNNFISDSDFPDILFGQDDFWMEDDDLYDNDYWNDFETNYYDNSLYDSNNESSTSNGSSDYWKSYEQEDNTYDATTVKSAKEGLIERANAARNTG